MKFKLIYEQEVEIEAKNKEIALVSMGVIHFIVASLRLFLVKKL
jgi:hypothetical protein